jgi:hypothetical protein
MQYTSSVGLAAKRGKGHSLCLAWKVLRLLGFKPVVAIPPSLRSAGGNTEGISKSDITVPLRLRVTGRHAAVVGKPVAAVPLKLSTAARETEGWNESQKYKQFFHVYGLFSSGGGKQLIFGR